MSKTALKVKCGARKTNGDPCPNWAVRGAKVCNSHGLNKKARRKAAVIAEVFDWGLNDETVDPGETLIKLLSQSSRRADRYGRELAEMVEETNLRDALISETWIPSEHGDSYKAGEEIRGLAKLEFQERKFCGELAVKAVAAGLAEREVRLAERYGAVFADGIKAIMDKLGLTEEQAARLPQVIETTVLELSAG